VLYSSGINLSTMDRSFRCGRIREKEEVAVAYGAFSLQLERQGRTLRFGSSNSFSRHSRES
jgi:hypothetical protein